MKDIDAFIKVFGDITVLQVLEWVFALSFVAVAYKKFKKYLIDKHEIEKKRDEDLKKTLSTHEEKIKEALDGIHKYPEWRQQSIEIQNELKGNLQLLATALEDCSKRLQQMEDANDRRTRNQLRDRLLQSYRYYTNVERNPAQSWTQMESEAFWELFKDYEDAGGDGYMHTEVMPAMNRLHVVEIGTVLDRGGR